MPEPVVLPREPAGDGELVEPDADGAFIKPESPLPPEPIEPEALLLDADGVPVVPLTDPDMVLPEPDIVGDAEGEPLASEMPATSIACWLQRSKSARLSEPAPATAAAGTMNAATAADAKTILDLMTDLP